MKCYFPIPSTPTNNQRVSLGFTDHTNHKKTTIQQLREENQLLKQQISMLMNTRNHNQVERHNKNPFIDHQQNAAFNQEDLVQQNYLNKMSKLKAGRSSSKKANSRYATTPSSPKKVNQQSNGLQRIPFVPIPPNRENLKIMIVQKDNNGKFYRDRQSQQKVKTIRMNSPQAQLNFTRPIQIENNFLRFFPKDVPKAKGHQRSETTPIQELNADNGDLTKRIAPRPFNTNANIFQIYEKDNQFGQLSSKPCSFKKIVQKQQPILKFSSKGQENSQFLKVKLLSPRGAAYIDKQQASTRVNTKKSTEQGYESNLESNLSIEKGMNETKRNRKLRYDIYLEDDKNN